MYYLYTCNNAIIGFLVLTPFVVKGWHISTAITTTVMMILCGIIMSTCYT